MIIWFMSAQHAIFLKVCHAEIIFVAAILLLKVGENIEKVKQETSY